MNIQEFPDFELFDHTGCKPRPSSAEVTAYPPTSQLVLNGLQRG